MGKLKLTKLIVSSLVVFSVLTLNPIGANAEWRKDSFGWWNKEGSSWSVGWKEIDGEWYYFDNNGYMQIGWIQYDGKWYYLCSSGAMAHDTTIDGYSLDSDGAWIQNTQNISKQSTSTENNLSNVDPNATTISGVTGVRFQDITKIIFYDGRGNLNKPVTIEDTEKIKEFMGYLDGYTISNKIDYSKTETGWAHSVAFYINNKQVMYITFGKPLIINGGLFTTVQGSLNTEKIDAFLKTIDPSHKTLL